MFGGFNLRRRKRQIYRREGGRRKSLEQEGIFYKGEMKQPADHLKRK